MTIGCNIWMICLKLNWYFYGLSRMLQLSQFVWTPCYSVWDVFNNFLLNDATDRSKISGDQKRFFIALSLYPISFFANTPFKSERNHFFNDWKENEWNGPFMDDERTKWKKRNASNSSFLSCLKCIFVNSPVSSIYRNVLVHV